MEKTDSVKKATESLKTNNVRWVHSAFVDVRGILQDMVLPARDYLTAEPFKEGIGFDGSSVRGFKSIEESDMIFMPDAKTLSIMPWVTDEKQKSAIVLGDVYEAYGGKEPSVVDPEATLQKGPLQKPNQWVTLDSLLLNWNSSSSPQLTLLNSLGIFGLPKRRRRRRMGRTTGRSRITRNQTRRLRD